jgi:hypothetical protein
LSLEDLDRLIVALVLRSPLSEEEHRALILELVAHRRCARSASATTRASGEIAPRDVDSTP